jgi:hypothetical protein
VRELDAHGGRTIASPQLFGAPYPLSVTLTAGAAWVASVENGYVWGTLSRIDLRTHRVRVLWRKQESSVQYSPTPLTLGQSFLVSRSVPAP